MSAEEQKPEVPAAEEAKARIEGAVYRGDRVPGAVAREHAPITQVLQPPQRQPRCCSAPGCTPGL